MYCWVILQVLFLISSVISAPVEENSLINIIQSDNRTVQLREHKFIAECQKKNEFSNSLCFAMYELALSFDSEKLEFIRGKNATYVDGKFCEALSNVLPDTPRTDAAKAIKDQAIWFKDILKKDNGEATCNDRCFYNDPESYETKLLPVCRFLFNQYTYLDGLSNDKAQQVINIKPDVIGEVITTKVDKLAGRANVPSFVKISTSRNVGALRKEDTSSNLSANQDAADQPIPTSNPTTPSTTVPIVPAADIAKNLSKVSEEKSEMKNIDKVIKSGNDSNSDEIGGVNDSKKSNEATNINNEGQGEVNEAKKAVEEVNINDGENLEDGEIKQTFEVASDNPMEKDQDPFMQNEIDPDEEYEDDSMARNNNKLTADKMPQEELNEIVEDEVPHKNYETVEFKEDPDSNFFTYLCGLMFLCVLLYILHQNRHKLMALCLEGRRGRRSRDRSRSGSKAAYSKLDCNLEEAITSKKSLSGKSMDIIY
ncbi:CLUMA_CG018072, isoform A [Clunio marinus]|uniref:CLUMA_CG018072, isoform A n=1 Tax=Clunio marinus TaxID=568069 RepID=A0A1J1J1E6_9DIPT|nr:CLUMA_CG018072, isoform A [Clunio marinus]